MKKMIVGTLLVLSASAAWAGDYDDEDRRERESRAWWSNEEKQRRLDQELERTQRQMELDKQEYREKMMLLEMEKIRDAVDRGGYHQNPYSWRRDFWEANGKQLKKTFRKHPKMQENIYN
uniref:CpxP superfamily protein n=1 Tax=Geobacter metallireducens TaxID=28232 RepID=A0A831XEM4_GEOME